MKRLQISLALLLVFGVATGVDAQGTPAKPSKQGPATGSGSASGSISGGGTALTGDTLDQLKQLMEHGTLAAILSDVDLAKAIGMDFEQWMQAMYLMDETQKMMLFIEMLDPLGQEEATWQAINTIRFILELQLYQLLTPAQQQQLDQIFEQPPATSGTTATGGTSVKASGK